jgi:uncharacterized protein YigE (DUF2233 family)
MILPFLVSTPALAESWRTLAPGIDYQRFTNGTGQAFRLDLRTVRLGIAIGSPVAKVETLARGTSSVLATNGSFFTPAGQSLGLLIDQGQEKNPLRQADWGVLTVTRNGRARLVHTRDYESRRDTDFAMQVGPRLVVRGRTLRFPLQMARRTAVGVLDDPHKLVLVVSEGALTTTRLAELMKSTFHAQFALNLDGGSSSQVWSNLPGVRSFQADRVANALIVRHRDGAP